jgi:hypothetical protein
MWGWVKTYCYHIWRNNYPLASYLLAPAEQENLKKLKERDAQMEARSGTQAYPGSLRSQTTYRLLIHQVTITYLSSGDSRGP